MRAHLKSYRPKTQLIFVFFYSLPFSLLAVNVFKDNGTPNKVVTTTIFSTLSNVKYIIIIV